MIVIAKDAFLEPKKFFCENLLQPFLTYDYTPLSCNFRKINDLFFTKSKNPVFWPKFAEKFFFSKIRLLHIRGFVVMYLCAKNHSLFMIFGTKVHDYKPSNVKEPDFRKKKFSANLGQKTAKNGVFGLCEKIDRLFF